MQNILILGSEGFLGSVLVPHLIDYKFNITGVDECFFGENNNKNLKNFKLIKRDYNKLNKQFFKDFDYIIDLINISNDPASELNPEFTKTTNYYNKIKLYKKIKNINKIKKFIYMSSCSVYGHNKSLISEKSKPNPISLYAKLCLDFEKYIRKEKRVPFTILRLGTLYGWSKRMRYDIAINKIIRDMVFLNKVEVLGGMQLRFFCYNKFACNIIKEILTTKSNKYKNKVLNVGVFNTNIINLAKKILKLTKIKKIDLIHEKHNIDNRSYEVSTKTVKKNFWKLNLKKYVNKSILETFNKIKKDKTPFAKNKVTLNIYKKFLKKNEI